MIMVAFSVMTISTPWSCGSVGTSSTSLESIAHSDSCGFCRLKQTVIESLSTSKTVPFTVVCHGKHYYKALFPKDLQYPSRWAPLYGSYPGSRRDSSYGNMSRFTPFTLGR